MGADGSEDDGAETDEALSSAQLHDLIEAMVVVGSEVQLEPMLRRLVATASRLVDARYGALGVLDETGTRLAAFLHTGMDDDRVAAIGTPPEGRGVLGRLIIDPQPIRLDDIGTDPEAFGFPPHHPVMTSFLGVPVRVRGEVFGNLYLTDKQGAPRFSSVDERLTMALAAVAGMAIENTRLHARITELAVVEERDRLARELHDTVIQRIFATGLVLQGVASGLDEPAQAGRLRAAANDLDQTVHYVRSRVFELDHAATPVRSVRRELLELLDEVGGRLGLETSMEFDGPVDDVLTLDAQAVLVRHLFAIVRDSVREVASGANATRAEVSVRVAGDLTVRVSLDGVGLDALHDAGESPAGLVRLRQDAEKIGGTFEVHSPASGGTEIAWTVPLLGS